LKTGDQTFNMFKEKRVAVVVPAHNEEKFIAGVIDTMPAYVDKIYAVNDASQDSTAQIILNKAKENSRVVPVDRDIQGGVGAAILSGHVRALQDNMDIIAVMAGDGQMDPAVLERILAPVIDGKADYSKGNRLSSPEDIKEMPAWRSFGNFLLTLLSRASSGYWRMSDPQNGYTAISAEILRKLDLDRVEKGFAFENNMLARLNVLGARVMDVPHPAVYRGQKSKIRYGKFIINTTWILWKDFVWRIWHKYVKRSSK
jgi:glycosyltransferase involved in cell wall biosynthesis